MIIIKFPAPIGTAINISEEHGASEVWRVRKPVFGRTD